MRASSCTRRRRRSGGAALRWLGGVLGRDAGGAVGAGGEHRAIIGGAAVPAASAGRARADLGQRFARRVRAASTAAPGAPEMVRAVMEGVAFSVRWAFEALQQSAGTHAHGRQYRRRWRAVRRLVPDPRRCAGLCAAPCRVTEAAAIGAAILAGLGSGVMPSLTRGGARGS